MLILILIIVIWLLIAYLIPSFRNCILSFTIRVSSRSNKFSRQTTLLFLELLSNCIFLFATHSFAHILMKTLEFGLSGAVGFKFVLLDGSAQMLQFIARVAQ